MCDAMAWKEILTVKENGSGFMVNGSGLKVKG